VAAVDFVPLVDGNRGLFLCENFWRKPWLIRECSRFALIRIPTRETRTLKTRRLLADKLGKGLSYSWYPPARDFCVISSQSFPAFYEPWLPSLADKPPTGAAWLHEIKHDSFRRLVRRDVAGVNPQQARLDRPLAFAMTLRSAGP